jgi:hypothetical protein
MIWALLGALIAAAVIGGSGGGDMVEVRLPVRDRIEETIEDETRREEVDAILTEAEEQLTADVESQVRTMQRLREISADRSTSRADIEAAFEDEERHNYAERFIDLRFRLKNTLTREEWESLFPQPETDATDAP